MSHNYFGVGIVENLHRVPKEVKQLSGKLSYQGESLQSRIKQQIALIDYLLSKQDTAEIEFLDAKSRSMKAKSTLREMRDVEKYNRDKSLLCLSRKGPKSSGHKRREAKA